MFIAKAYALNDGGDVVTCWLAENQRRHKVIARLDAYMIHLLQQPREGWTRPQFDTLRDGVGEVRFKVQGILYRPIGFFGPNRNDFTFLFFATKRKDFEPLDAIDIAVARKEHIERGMVRTVDINRWNP